MEQVLEGLPNILYKEMRKYFPIYEEAVSHIMTLIFFFISVAL
jgi:hypothetical protein